MENKVWELFKKYIKGKIDVYGIEIYPVNMDEDFAVFSMKNPKNIPYNRFALVGYIIEKIVEFKTFTGIEKFSVGIEINAKDIYVPKELGKQVNHILKEIDTLEKKQQLIHLRIYVKHISTKFEMDNDMVKIVNVVEAFDFEGPEGIESLEEAVEVYKNLNFRDRFVDSEQNYQIIDVVLNDYPTLVDSEWQVNYTITEFV